MRFFLIVNNFVMAQSYFKKVTTLHIINIFMQLN